MNENFSIISYNGNLITLNNKSTLVIIVANECGLLDKQFKGLQKLKDLWPKLRIICVLTNQFYQCSDNTDKVVEKLKKKYNLNCEYTKKVNVNGKNTHPFIKNIKNQKTWGIGLTQIRWNFEKFLLKDKKVIHRYMPLTSPINILNYK